MQRSPGHAPPASLQHGAVTPVPGPAFGDTHAASPAGAAATAGNMSRAPSPAPRTGGTGGAGAGGANPFARKPAEAPENSPGNASAVAAAAAKRKAPSGNPFARKAKAAKA